MTSRAGVNGPRVRYLWLHIEEFKNIQVRCLLLVVDFMERPIMFLISDSSTMIIVHIELNISGFSLDLEK